MKKITYLFLTLFVSFSYSVKADVSESITESETENSSGLIPQQTEPRLEETQRANGELSSEEITEVTIINSATGWTCTLFKSGKMNCWEESYPGQLGYSGRFIGVSKSRLNFFSQKKIPLSFTNHAIIIFLGETAYIFLGDKFKIRSQLAS